MSFASSVPLTVKLLNVIENSYILVSINGLIMNKQDSEQLRQHWHRLMAHHLHWAAPSDWIPLRKPTANDMKWETTLPGEWFQSYERAMRSALGNAYAPQN